MLILDKARALDRMIYAASTPVEVPEPFVRREATSPAPPLRDLLAEIRASAARRPADAQPAAVAPVRQRAGLTIGLSPL